MIIPSQCRAARAMLNWSRATLSEKSSVAERTIVDFEREARVPQASTKLAIATALEKAGIEFTNDGSPGVKLRK